MNTLCLVTRSGIKFPSVVHVFKEACMGVLELLAFVSYKQHSPEELKVNIKQTEHFKTAPAVAAKKTAGIPFINRPQCLHIQCTHSEPHLLQSMLGSDYIHL